MGEKNKKERKINVKHSLVKFLVLGSIKIFDRTVFTVGVFLWHWRSLVGAPHLYSLDFSSTPPS